MEKRKEKTLSRIEEQELFPCRNQLTGVTEPISMVRISEIVQASRRKWRRVKNW